MVIEEKKDAVIALLRKTAQANGVCSFASLHSAFDAGTPSNDVYDTLEEASLALAPSDVAIYSVLLAKKETLLPGSGFFDVFKNKRGSEYDSIAGRNAHPMDLTDSQMLAIVELERSRVYAHAASEV